MNQGRIYQCGTVLQPPRSNHKSFTITLREYLCKNNNFKEPAWTRRIGSGKISVDGRVVTDPDFSLSPGSKVAYHRSPWNEPVIRVIDGSDDDEDVDDPHVLRVIYKDEYLMAVHKPSGFPTMPSQTYFEYSVLNVLRNSQQTFLAPPQPVHRLGVGTSGVVLIATSLEARRRLTASIRNRSVRKIYRALVQGADILSEMRIDCPIGPVPFPIGGGTIYAACPVVEGDEYGSSNNQRVKVSKASKGTQAKPALSMVRVIQRNRETNTAIVEVEIPTGRPHQIRIHMAYVGHPLVGDPLYRKGGIPDCRKQLFPKRSKQDEDIDTDDDGDDDDDDDDGGGKSACGIMGNNVGNSTVGDMIRRVPLPRDCGYSLHAYQITIDHPTPEGNSMTFTAKPPRNLMG